MPEQFYFDDMWEGEVVLRDRYQFELKSLYSPLSTRGEDEYTLEFYFFLPAALQVNRHTYSREQFYSDLTGLLRYKTPEFTVRELLNTGNPRSPIFRIRSWMAEDPEGHLEDIEAELKLFGNILRSSVRNHIRVFVETLASSKPCDPEQLATDAGVFCQDFEQVRQESIQLLDELQHHFLGSPTEQHAKYIDEFMSITIEKYLTRLLQEVRQKNWPELMEVDGSLRRLITTEVSHRQERDYVSPPSMNQARNREARIYRTGLLSKFTLGALMLSVERREIILRFQHFIGSFAAGVAMFVYMLLFVWQGYIFVINSFPFILLTTVFYILKDRMKEVLRAKSSKLAFEWYPDYVTEIRSPDASTSLGQLIETFSFISESQVPKEVLETRERGTNREVPDATRLQRIIYYKRKVKLAPELANHHKRRYELNDIFRFNISRFLRKASDPVEDRIVMDVQTGALVTVPSPKVYHINLVLKQSFTGQDRKRHSQYRKIRLVVDKDGINRIERLGDDDTLRSPLLD
jgi:hypothetical protein